MSIRLNVRLDSSQVVGEARQFTVQLDGGPHTAPFAIGEGPTESDARLDSIENLRMILELLEKGLPDSNGWLGTIADGWSMSPVVV